MTVTYKFLHIKAGEIITKRGNAVIEAQMGRGPIEEVQRYHAELLQLQQYCDHQLTEWLGFDGVPAQRTNQHRYRYCTICHYEERLKPYARKPVPKQ